MRRNKGGNFLNKTNSKRHYGHRKESNNYLNIPDKYKKLLEVKWPKPSVLSNAVLQQIPLDKFKYSEKIDGVHTFLLIFDKQFYNVTDLSKIYQIEEKTIKDFNFSGDAILETEFYDNIEAQVYEEKNKWIRESRIKINEFYTNNNNEKK